MTSEPRGSVRERYVRKDFRGSSHRILAAWVRELPAGAWVLELGAGAGHIAALAARRDLHWLALEGSSEHLGDLKRSFAGAAVLDIEALDRLPAGLGAVIAADVLEHLAAPERTVRLVREALRPGGRFLVSVPNVAHLYVRLSLLRGRFPYADRGILDRTHRVFFTRRSITELLESAGFRIDRQAVSTVPLPLAFPRAPVWLLAGAGRLLEVATRTLPTLLGYQVIVDARRE